jgi:hypothetical protein
MLGKIVIKIFEIMLRNTCKSKILQQRLNYTRVNTKSIKIEQNTHFNFKKVVPYEMQRWLVSVLNLAVTKMEDQFAC